jgi:methionine-gamma-lyase
VPNKRGFSTRAIHAARYKGPGPGQPVVFPLFQTASFHFEDAQTQEAVMAGREPGFAYSRPTNPTTAALHRAVAELEGAEDAISFASGIGAIHAAMTAVVGAGDHILCTQQIYGGTYNLLTRTLPRFGVSHSFVDGTDLAAVERAIRPETRLIWTETICNPTTTIPDLRALAELAHAHGALLAVDSTFTSPYLARPLEFGVDLVVHSATKYIGGHGDLLAGIVAGSRELVARARVICADVGGPAAPLEGWLMLRGLKTLALRMERHVANALGLAQFLTEHPRVERVNYPGLPTHPQHALAAERYDGFGGVLSFVVPGGKPAAFRVINALTLPLRAASLGDVDTLVTHPPTTSHRLLRTDEREAAGIPDGLIRVSVGLEDLPDLLDDFQQALEKA